MYAMLIHKLKYTLTVIITVQTTCIIMLICMNYNQALKTVLIKFLEPIARGPNGERIFHDTGLGFLDWRRWEFNANANINKHSPWGTAREQTDAATQWMCAIS